jgi:hypothetical protein
MLASTPTGTREISNSVFQNSKLLGLERSFVFFIVKGAAVTSISLRSWDAMLALIGQPATLILLEEHPENKILHLA